MRVPLYINPLSASCSRTQALRQKVSTNSVLPIFALMVHDAVSRMAELCLEDSCALRHHFRDGERNRTSSRDKPRPDRYSNCSEILVTPHVQTNRVELLCHSSKPTATIDGIDVFVRRVSLRLELIFQLRGDISGLQIPSRKSASVGAELWRHTCFESFIAIEGEAAYHEFNLAPSGQWAVYEFRGYRDGRLLADERLNPQILVSSTPRTFELKASIPLDFLSVVHATAPLCVGLAAVIETRDDFSYWAIRHPREKPDFHDREGFALRLEGPAV